jgi:hypothetical protein
MHNKHEFEHELKREHELAKWLYREDVPLGTEAARFFNWRMRHLGF